MVTSHDVAKGAGTTLIARLGGVIDVVAQPLYVALFGLAGYGIYQVLWLTVNLIENIADLGQTSALQRTVPQVKTERDATASLRAAIIMGVVPCIIIAAIVSMIAPSLVHLFNAAPEDQAQLGLMIRLFIWTLPLWAFVEVATSALRARRAFGPEIRLRLFWEQIVRMGLAVTFWMMGFGTMALIYAHILSLAIISILCVSRLRAFYDLSHFAEPLKMDAIWNDTAKAGFAVLPTNIVMRIFGDGPALVLNVLLPGSAGAVASALFVIARKISSIVQLVRSAFAYVLAPLASLASTGKTESVSQIYGFATRVSLAVALPLGVCLAALGPSLLAMFAEQAHVALPALIVLLGSRIVEAVSGAAAPIQQVIGGYRGQIVGGLVGVVAAALLIYALPITLLNVTIGVSIGLVIAALIPVAQLMVYERLHPFSAELVQVGAKAGVITLGALMAATLVNQGMLELLATVKIVPLPALYVGVTFMILITLLAALWCSCRMALPLADREALGKTGRALKLV